MTLRTLRRTHTIFASLWSRIHAHTPAPHFSINLGRLPLTPERIGILIQEERRAQVGMGEEIEA